MKSVPKTKSAEDQLLLSPLIDTTEEHRRNPGPWPITWNPDPQPTNSSEGFVLIEIQAPEFILGTILRRGVDFTFDFDALTEVYQESYLYACGFEIVDQLGFVCRMKVFYFVMGDVVNL